MDVKALIKELKKLPQDAKVYMSIDAEGNDYSDIKEGYGLDGSFSYHERDNTLIIYPWNEHLQYEDLLPSEVGEGNNE